MFRDDFSNISHLYRLSHTLAVQRACVFADWIKSLQWAKVGREERSEKKWRSATRVSSYSTDHLQKLKGPLQKSSASAFLQNRDKLSGIKSQTVPIGSDK